MSIDILEQDIETNTQGRSIPIHERKARKAFAKMGLQPVEDIFRVVVRKQKQTAFVVSKPDVFKSSSSDMYVVFGEATTDDSQNALKVAAQQAFNNQQPIMDINDLGAPANINDEYDDEITEEVDESCVDPDDILNVIEATGVSKVKAIKALRRNDNIIDAIMSLNGS